MVGIGGSNLAIGISLVLRDQFTGRARAAQAALRSIDDDARRAMRAQMTMQRNMNAVGAGIGIMAIRGMTDWAKVGAQFGYTMKYVNTIAKHDKRIGFGALSKQAKTLGVETMFTARQVADGMKYMAMAGQSTYDIFNNINAAVALAGSTMSTLEGKGGAADIMTNIMRGFDIEATKKNSMYVADVLSTATTSANTNLWDLHEAMKYSISTAKDLNITLEETAAMMMMAGDAGIQGSMAGTATENMMRYITKAADEATKGKSGKALAMLGLSPKDLQDARGNLLSISPLLKVISGRIVAMQEAGKGGNVMAQNILVKLFGVRGKREASLLIRNLAKMDEYVNKLSKDSPGRATRNLKKMMDTLQGSGYQLNSSWESLKIAFTEAIEPVVIPLLNFLTGAVKLMTQLASTPIGKFLTVAAAGFVVVKTAVMGYRAVVLSLRLLHMQMGASAGSAASQVVANYGRMTMAANTYAASAQRANMFPGMGMMSIGSGRIGKFMAKRGLGTWTGMARNGAMYSMHRGGTSFIKAGSRPLGWSIGAGTKLAGLGKFIGKASPIAMLAGMGLEMGSEAVGSSTTLGKGLGIAGDTLGWAGTGAMLGSVVPGVGNVVGAIVGGIGGLMYGLYSRLSDVSDEVKAAKDKEKKGKSWDVKAWRKKLRVLQHMTTGEAQYFYGDIGGSQIDSAQAMNILNRGGMYIDGQKQGPTRITINIDGRSAMDKVIDSREYEQLINLGMF